MLDVRTDIPKSYALLIRETQAKQPQLINEEANKSIRKDQEEEKTYILRRDLEPTWRGPLVWKSRCGDTLPPTVHATHGGGVSCRSGDERERRRRRDEEVLKGCENLAELQKLGFCQFITERGMRNTDITLEGRGICLRCYLWVVFGLCLFF